MGVGSCVLLNLLKIVYKSSHIHLRMCIHETLIKYLQSKTAHRIQFIHIRIHIWNLTNKQTTKEKKNSIKICLYRQCLSHSVCVCVYSNLEFKLRHENISVIITITNNRNKNNSEKS